MSSSNQEMDHISDDSYVTDYENDDNVEVDTDDEDIPTPFVNPSISVPNSTASASNPFTTSAFRLIAPAISNTTSALGPVSMIATTSIAATVPSLVAAIPALSLAMPNPTITASNANGLTPNTLRPINDLTRSSARPGDMQYNEYIAYLRSIGHVIGAIGPATPILSNLQHNTGDRIDNLTDFRADQALWSMENIPEILYALSQPPNWLERSDLIDPPLKQYLINGQYLRDLPILPDHISNALEGWRFEAWVRMDPRVGHANIVARIPTLHRPANKSRIQMRTKRFRASFPCHGWVSVGKNFQRERDALRNQVVAAGIPVANNTTRGVSWGLIDPRQGPAGGRIAVPVSQRQPSTVDESTFNSAPVSSVVPASVPFTAPFTVPFTAPSTLSGSAVTTSHTTLATNTNFPTSTNILSTIPAISITQAGPSIPSLHPSLTNSLSNQNPLLVPNTMGSTTPRRSPRNQQILSSDLGSTPTDAGANVAPRENRVTVTYQGRVLTLRTQRERVSMSSATVTMMQTFYPAGSEERARQLEYVLCPVRAPHGFIDNHGNEEYIPADVAASNTDVDVIYIEGSSRRFGEVE